MFAATPAASPWAPYASSKDEPWDLRRVAHLHRRAGFAATWKEVQRDLKDGPAASVDRLLKGKARAEGVPENFAETADLLADSSDGMGRLKAWWAYRLLFSPDPLGERLTLMWHNHFATSGSKVRDVGALRKQNETFRELARAPFGKLLARAARDPALLLFLDAPSSKKGHPNENLARELMELFTLGVGHFTEKDVKEAARALTGWTVAKGAFREADADHDGGEKNILGRKGRWKGADLLKLLLEQPATGARLAFRVCEQFLGEGSADEAALKALADGMRKRDLDVGWAVETVLRSRLFHGNSDLGRRVQGPVEFVVGAARALELFDPPPSTVLLADWCARLGQDLFFPPNVGGWPGGRAWVSTRALIGRAAYATALVEGQLFRDGKPADALALARRHGRTEDMNSMLTFFIELLQGTTPDRAALARLAGALGPKAALTGETARHAAALALAMPEAQVA